jgi:hypothetical protein
MGGTKPLSALAPNPDPEVEVLRRKKTLSRNVLRVWPATANPRLGQSSLV